MREILKAKITVDMIRKLAYERKLSIVKGECGVRSSEWLVWPLRLLPIKVRRNDPLTARFCCEDCAGCTYEEWLLRFRGDIDEKIRFLRLSRRLGKYYINAFNLGYDNYERDFSLSHVPDRFRKQAINGYEDGKRIKHFITLRG